MSRFSYYLFGWFGALVYTIVYVTAMDTWSEHSGLVWAVSLAFVTVFTFLVARKTAAADARDRLVVNGLKRRIRNLEFRAATKRAVDTVKGWDR